MKTTWMSVACKWVCGLGLMGAVVAGCADEPAPDPGPLGQTAPNNTVNNTPNNTPNNTANNTATIDRRLTIEGSQVLEVSFGGRARINVRYESLDGQGVPGEVVEFRVVGGTGVSLDVTSATTDVLGVATNDVFGGDTEGVFELLVEAPRANPVKYTVYVFPLEEAAYRISSTYDGQTRLTGARVMLISGDIRCGSVRFDALPQIQDEQSASADAVGVEDVVFGDLPNGASHTVLILANMAPGVPAAFGCNDSAPAIVDGMGVQLVVPLQELQPVPDGGYAIETRLDLTDALPDAWADNVNFVGNIFADPVAAFVDFLFGDPNDNGDGFASSFLIDTPGNRALVSGALNDLIRGTALGDQLDSLFGFGGEAYGVVTNFSVRGEVLFEGGLTSQGGLNQQADHRYDTVLVDWTRGCEDNDPNCGVIEIETESIQGVGVLASAFGGRVQGDRLYINPHTFNFNYGAIAVAIMERVVLPFVFGVNSFSDALGLIIDCNALGNELFDSLLLSLAATEGCEFALDALADEAIRRLSGAGLSLPNLSLSTFEPGENPQHEGCRFIERDYQGPAPARSIEFLGTDLNRCVWDAQFEAEEGDGTADADFFARQGNF